MALTKAEQEELELLELEEQEAQFLAQQKPQIPKVEIDPITSAGRQFARFASGGFADELNQGLEKLGQNIGVAGLGGPVSDIRLLDKEPTQEEIDQAAKNIAEQERKAYKQDFISNPALSGAASVAGTLASPINKLGGGLSVAKQAALQSGITGFGEADTENLKDRAIQAGISTAVGGLAGKAIGSLAPGLKSGGEYLRKQAEKLAEKATGATAVQAQKFAKGSGRELLERGIVQFGDTPEQIAKKATRAIKQAETDISTSLKALDNANVNVSQDSIIESLSNKITELSQDASQAPIVKRLQSIIDDITLTGKSNISPSAAEKTKRGFNKIARNWLDPQQGEAGKIAYLAYRDAVEEAAKKVNPGLLDKFKTAKQTYGLLNPIEEAAERRAAQLNQSPFGGLLDATSILAGGALGGEQGFGAGLGLAGLRRIAAPRLASSLAKTVDVLGRKFVGGGNLASQTNQFIPTALLQQSNIFKYTSEMAEQKYMESKQQKTPTQKAFEANEKRKLIKAK